MKLMMLTVNASPALKSDEVHVIWLRVDERVDSRVGTIDDFPEARPEAKAKHAEPNTN
jgi:hypothetical protein